MVQLQEHQKTAEEDFLRMIKILRRDTPESVRISDILNPSADTPENSSYLASHNELRHAVMFLLNAAQLLSPDEVKYEISRRIFDQVGLRISGMRKKLLLGSESHEQVVWHHKHQPALCATLQ